MRFTRAIIPALGSVISVTAAYASPFTYVLGNSDAGVGHIGTVDLATGKFQQIGQDAPVSSEGLAAGPNGLLYTMAFNGDLYSIDPGTGSFGLVGPSGLGDCSMPDSPCGPTSNLTLGSANGQIYATDFQNRIYNVNPSTGAATLIGNTGIPPLPFVPDTQNADGTLNFYEEALFGAGGNLYVIFDAIRFDPTTASVAGIAVAPALYQINPSTGVGTVVGPTDVTIGAVASVNGAQYAFNLVKGQVFSLDVGSGKTSLLYDTDPAAGVVRGAATATPTPEPASCVLTGIGIAAFIWRRRRLRCQAMDTGVLTIRWFYWK